MLIAMFSRSTYSPVFSLIRQLLHDINPSFAITDFEIALNNAFVQNITIIGCWFHFYGMFEQYYF